MATYSKVLLSGCTNGKQIKVVQTATAGTTIHTATSGSTNLDEIWLYAVNSDTTARKLTVEWGGVASPDDLIEFTVPAESGLFLITAGLVIKGNATPLVVRAFCATANVVMIAGFVNRITA